MRVRRRRKQYKALLMRLSLLLALVVTLGLAMKPIRSEASWVERGEGSIYEGSEDEVGSGLGSLSEDAEEGEIDDGSNFFVDLINTIFCWLFTTVGNLLFSMLDAIGASLDKLIYGRLVTDTPLFTFDLGKNNVYGIVGSALFNIIRGTVVTFVMVLFMVRIVASIWKRGDLAKSSFKDNIHKLVLSMLLLALMPNFLDVALYIRDLILYSIGTEGATTLFGGSNPESIISVLAAAANQDIISGIVYVAAVVLNLYFLIGYIGVALTMTIDYVMFPLVVIKGNFDRQALSGWVLEMVSCMAVPVIDAILIMIPSYLGIYASSLSISTAIGVSVVQLILCYLILPARAAARGILGLRYNPMESAGLSAATVFGLAAARGIKSAFRGGREEKKNAELDRERANAEEDLAQLDKDEKSQEMTGAFAGQNKEDLRDRMPSADQIMNQKNKDENMEDFGEEKTDDSPFGKEQSYESGLASHIKAEEEDGIMDVPMDGVPMTDEERRKNAEEMQRLDDELNGLTKDKKKLQAAKDAVLNQDSLSDDEKQEQLDALDKQLADADAKISNIQKEREALMGVDEKIRAANKRKSQLEQDYQDVANDNSISQSEKDERLDAINGEIQNIDNEISGLQKQKQRLRVEQEKAELLKEPKTLRAELDGLKESSAQIEQQREELVRKRDSLKEKQGEYAAGTAEYQALGKEIDGLNRQIASNDQALGKNQMRQNAIQNTLEKQQAGLYDRQAFNLHERVKAQNSYDSAKARMEDIQEKLNGKEGNVNYPGGSVRRKNLERDLASAKQEMDAATAKIGELSNEDRRISARLREISPDFNKYTADDLKGMEQNLRAAKNEQAVRRASLQKEVAAEKLEMENSGPGMRAEHKTRIARLNGEIADCNLKSAQIDQAIEGIRQQANEMNYGHAGGAGGRASRGRTGGYGSAEIEDSYERRRNAIMERYANVDNFERPEFAGISHEKRAALYRERALRTEAIRAKRRVGSVAGALAGGAMGLWLGGQGVGIGAFLGQSIGSNVGIDTAIRNAAKNSINRPVDYTGTPLDVHIAADLRDNSIQEQAHTVERVRAELANSLQTERFQNAVTKELSSQDMIRGQIKVLFKKHGVNRNNYESKRGVVLQELQPQMVKMVERAETNIVETCAGHEYASLSPVVKQNIVKSVAKPNMDVFYDLCESVYLGTKWEPQYEEYLDD